jgi:hypothetical protein
MDRADYSASLSEFLTSLPDSIIGRLTQRSRFPVENAQVRAWAEQVALLKDVLRPYAGEGRIYFEYAVPRLGKRIDTVLVLRGLVFVIEFKVGERRFARYACDQVWDYALDLKNFHETSHDKVLVPVLVVTEAPPTAASPRVRKARDGVVEPLLCNKHTLAPAIENMLTTQAATPWDVDAWEAGRYRPTPTIVEAAMALYAGHGVAEIARSDAGAKNLGQTTQAVESIIAECRARQKKAICFVTGVPGAGKTLVGLNIATRHADAGELHSVFLSGNGPLVRVLQEALARDQVQRERQRGRSVTKSQVTQRVKAFVQNVHHFRDEYLRDARPPSDHIAVFDEAQRAWNAEQTAAFMERKKNKPGFTMSEPEFLISCLDRHPGWAVIVCLVGGGQEINTGEAGISEWLAAVLRSFPHWEVHISAELHDNEYAAETALVALQSNGRVQTNPDLHLSVSMRSFRAENVSTLVKRVLDLDMRGAREVWMTLRDRYPIVLCRSVPRAKAWLREQARGSERYGLVVSSQAQRLRPHAIHVKSPVDPVHWFLHGKDDVRSSYYMEDVATEFQVQGLELDWAGVVWDGDFRKSSHGWEHYSFVGTRWQRIRAADRQAFQKNAYRVLLTRARQGMVIVVPEGDEADPTRDPRYYDETFHYLQDIGFPVL